MTLERRIKELTLGDFLRIIRELALIVVLGYLAVQLFSGNIALDLTKLSAPELVSLLLAFFAISLSAAFFFAATSASSRFYDYVNKFNKDTSELLGRLDEQLKSVSSRQSELRDSFDRYYHGLAAPTSLEETNAEEKLEEAEGDLRSLVQDLLATSDRTAEEKRQLEQKISEMEEEITRLRSRSVDRRAKQLSRVRRYTLRKIRSMGLEEALDTPPEELLLTLARTGIPVYRGDLHDLGFLKRDEPSKRDDVTRDGVEFLGDIIKQMIEQSTDGDHG